MKKKKQYQKDINVKKHVPTKEWKPLYKIFKYLNCNVRMLSIACAEGFDVFMARKWGYKADGIEIHLDKIKRAKQHMNLDLIHGDIFERFGLLEKYNCFIVCRFFHNVGQELTNRIMRKINQKRDYIMIVKYKPGKYKETGKPRQPLATKKGISNLFDLYGLKGQSFPQEFMVGAKGRFKDVPKMLRKHIKQEGV
jgi:hypothetical protein